jgi:spore germination protein GerM
MQEQTRRPRGIIIGLALIGASASVAAVLAWLIPHPQPPATTNSAKPGDPLAQPLTPNPTATNKSQPSKVTKAAPETAAKPTAPVAEPTLQVYWLQDSGQTWDLVAVPLTLKADDRPETALSAAVNYLLASPPDGNLTTTIPQGTQLNDLKVEADGIHVDLSQPFKASGGSTGSTGRIGQILYTVTSLNPDAPVWLSVEGKRLEEIGGEGLMVEQPLTRQSFERDFKH